MMKKHLCRNIILQGRRLCLVLQMAVIYACSGEQMTSSVVDRFMETEVKLPLQEMGLVGDNPLNLDEVKYVCVLYADSINCTSCYVNKLAYWEAFEKDAKKECDRFTLCVIVQGRESKQKTIERVQYYSGYVPPTYIDTSGVFLRDNPMVDSSRVLRSFLMDASGRVLVVGNPTANDGVARSMIEAMTEESDQVKEQGRREDGDDA